MSAATEPRWYVLNSMHMATLCAGREDAEACAAEYDQEYPLIAPHRVAQLVDVSVLATERSARIEAQQRLADAQELAAKSGLAHRMAVQRCVQAAVADGCGSGA